MEHIASSPSPLRIRKDRHFPGSVCDRWVSVPHVLIAELARIDDHIKPQHFWLILRIVMGRIGKGGSQRTPQFHWNELASGSGYSTRQLRRWAKELREMKLLNYTAPYVEKNRQGRIAFDLTQLDERLKAVHARPQTPDRVGSRRVLDKKKKKATERRRSAAATTDSTAVRSSQSHT